MKSSLQTVFKHLRSLLQTHEADYTVGRDTTAHYGLDAPVGPATIKAWGGKAKFPKIPVAWVELKKNYVSYHLMGINGNARLEAKLSGPLRARMQGKTCFNFKEVDDALFQELNTITAESLQALRKGGYIADENN